MSLIRGNALNVPLRDESVDLVVTSPPYFALRSYTDSCQTCGGVAADASPTCTSESSAKSSTLVGTKQQRRVDSPADPDCAECNGAGRGHYDGQIGSEATPQDFLDALWAVTRECVRVLKPSGSIWVNLGDKYAGSGGHNNATLTGPSSKSTLGGSKRNRSGTEGQTATRRSAPDRYNQDSGRARPKSLMGLPWRYAIGCIDDLRLILRAEVIWSKPNGLPESVTDRVRRSHEQWFHFTREPRYFSAMDEVREPHAPWTLKAYQYEQDNDYARKVNGDRVDGGNAKDYAVANPLGKLPGSVRTVATEPLILPPDLPDHFAAFPSEWPRWIISGWCHEDGTVLDPFAGTGTTVAVANALGRHGIGLDLSADYLRVARYRCGDPKLRAKALGVDPPKAQVPGQLGLLEAS